MADHSGVGGLLGVVTHFEKGGTFGAEVGDGFNVFELVLEFDGHSEIGSLGEVGGGNFLEKVEGLAVVFVVEEVDAFGAVDGFGELRVGEVGVEAAGGGEVVVIEIVDGGVVGSVLDQFGIAGFLGIFEGEIVLFGFEEAVNHALVGDFEIFFDE